MPTFILVTGLFFSIKAPDVGKVSLPWLNYQFVRVVYIPGGLLPVDVLQNINSCHLVPLTQVKPPTWLKMCLGEDVVLDKEHPCLQDVTQQGRWKDNRNITKYQFLNFGH